jgi:RNA polymerase sigma-54 factor
VAIQQKLGLQPRLSQRLILTPSLQQAIRLLPLTTLELAEVLQQEVTENPLLEEVPVQEALASDLSPPDEERPEPERSEPVDDIEEAAASEAAPEPALGVVERSEDRVEEEETIPRERKDSLNDIELERFFDGFADDPEPRRGMGADLPERSPIENTLTESPDIYDYLLWQLHMTLADQVTTEIGEAIIQNLDEDGILRVELGDIAALGPYAEPDVERALVAVQSLDPPGIAARDLRECLRLQLRHLGLEGSPTDVMIRDFLKQLQSHQYAEIARQMNLSLEEVSAHLEIIRRLDPKPGLKYSRSEAAYIVPDVFVVKDGDDYRIVLNDEGLPRLRINRTYRRILEDRAPGSEATRSYVREKLRSALWLLKSVDQRQRTIHKVAESILRHQRGFFDHGIEQLRPLVLRDVATDIGMHESTVSRVVSNKYMHTPRGVYGLRFFFHSGITSSVGEAVSSVTIKDRIRKMVEAEHPSHPLSDARIAEVLSAEGLPIARRTVAKYREELRIAPSNLRKSVQ